MRLTQADQARVRPPEPKMFNDALIGRSMFSLVCISRGSFLLDSSSDQASVGVGILRYGRQGQGPLDFPDWLSLLPSIYKTS